MATRPTRILVPVDFSETASAALDYATFLAKTFGARIELLHVNEPLRSIAGDAVFVGSERTETAREYGLRIASEELAKLAEKLERENIATRVTVQEGIPWETIVARGEHADLIVMGTHGRTGISRMFLGSTTDKVVQRSVIPVLTTRGAIAEATVATAPVPSPLIAARAAGAS